jgi:cytochrome c oxidase assembly protein subunit 15
MMQVERKYRTFRKLGISTIIAVYLLILVGGIVRSTGSGMGCPDWPKCFGNWVPPTDIKELPANYKEVYSEKRKSKNVKLASMIEKMGYKELAQKIVNDKEMYRELDFNPAKTWIEYGNRLVGVTIGFLVFLVVVFSYSFIKTDKTVFILSFISFVLVGFEGWLGSIVVSTNLLPFTITLHMILALLIVCLLIYVILRSQKNDLPVYEVKNVKTINSVLIFLLAMTLIQIILGTQVREEIDLVAKQLGDEKRGEWLSNPGIEFLIHRSFSILIVIASAALIVLVRKSSSGNSNFLLKGSLSIAGLVLAEIFTGIVLNYFGFPALIQPVHLLLGTLIFGVQFLLLVVLKFNRVSTTPSYK